VRQMRLIVILAATLCAVGANAQVGTNTELLNPNLATAAELAANRELGAAKVSAIFAGRPFADGRALAVALGTMSADAQSILFSQMFLPINLNTAGREEIMLIPDMTPRMARELEEYRPYTSLEQFRREIGKDVDVNEVDRLQRYIGIGE
jgi:DNA uptake protein ComE-like DNA-binding protein